MTVGKRHSDKTLSVIITVTFCAAFGGLVSVAIRNVAYDWESFALVTLLMLVASTKLVDPLQERVLRLFGLPVSSNTHVRSRLMRGVIVGFIMLTVMFHQFFDIIVKDKLRMSEFIAEAFVLPGLVTMRGISKDPPRSTWFGAWGGMALAAATIVLFYKILGEDAFRISPGRAVIAAADTWFLHGIVGGAALDIPLNIRPSVRLSVALVMTGLIQFVAGGTAPELQAIADQHRVELFAMILGWALGIFISEPLDRIAPTLRNSPTSVPTTSRRWLWLLGAYLIISAVLTYIAAGVMTQVLVTPQDQLPPFMRTGIVPAYTVLRAVGDWMLVALLMQSVMWFWGKWYNAPALIRSVLICYGSWQFIKIASDLLAISFGVFPRSSFDISAFVLSLFVLACCLLAIWYLRSFSRVKLPFTRRRMRNDRSPQTL